MVINFIVYKITEGSYRIFETLHDVSSFFFLFIKHYGEQHMRLYHIFKNIMATLNNPKYNVLFICIILDDSYKNVIGNILPKSIFRALFEISKGTMQKIEQI